MAQALFGGVPISRLNQKLPGPGTEIFILVYVSHVTIIQVTKSKPINLKIMVMIYIYFFNEQQFVFTLV